MSKKPTFNKLFKAQRADLFGECCAAYCKKYKKRDIPDLVLKTFIRIVESPKPPTLDDGVEKLHEMVGKFDELEAEAKKDGVGDEVLDDDSVSSEIPKSAIVPKPE